MGYTPYLIAKQATGLETDLQPWLLPDDAYTEIFDGFVYRGVTEKRAGYSYYADGGQGGVPYTESRMVNRITSEPAKQAGVYVTAPVVSTYTLTLQNIPIRRGTVTIVFPGAINVVDNGLGGFTGTGVNTALSTINYTTGVVSITFTALPAAGQVYATYDYHPGLPVMGIASFYTIANVREMITFDTRFINKYNASTNRLDYLGHTLSISGISIANPAVITTTAAHNLSTGDSVFIYGVVGAATALETLVNNQFFVITVTGATTFTIPVNNVTAWTSGGIVAATFSGSNKNFFSWTNYDDGSGNPRLIFTNNKDEIGYYAPHLANSVGNYILYPTAAVPQFFMLDDNSAAITKLTALKVFEFKDRLVLMRTTENTIVKPKRFRISGTGTSSDDFRTSATGAGKIDVPSQSWLFGGDFNRDDFIFFTEAATWILKYSGNDIVPFVPDRLDASRGNQAPYGTISYLNLTTASSPRGLIGCDGYQVVRTDLKIPDYAVDEIDGQNFELCFAGVQDKDRDHYLLHPVPNGTKSERILVTNFEQGSISVYRVPLSCVGEFIQSFDVTWTQLLAFANWDELAAKYRTWEDFTYTAGEPFTVGGGHRGEIFSFTADEAQDNPLYIRNLTSVAVGTYAANVTITSDWNNYAVGDYIFIEGTAGSVKFNNKQGAITSVTDNYTFTVYVDTLNSTLSPTWTSGGQVSRCIPWSINTKQMNPYVSQGQACRIGWVYFYVSTSSTGLIDASDNPVNAKLRVEVILNDNQDASQTAVPYEINLTNISTENGTKTWYKMWVNQSARFLQLRLSNAQALTSIQLHAIMIGFSPSGALR